VLAAGASPPSGGALLFGPQSHKLGSSPLTNGERSAVACFPAPACAFAVPPAAMASCIASQTMAGSNAQDRWSRKTFTLCFTAVENRKAGTTLLFHI
jgi:hypothetical protein